MQAIRDRQSYAYNAAGLRVFNSATNRVFHYDLNGLLIAETDATTGATLIEYVYADRALVAVYTTRHTRNTLEWFYVNTNHLRTPEQLVDQNKQVVWQAEYRAFGVWQLSIEQVTFNLRFPGQYVDEETGLVNNWHRYYDPELGRYITPDPLGLYDGVNTYAYAGLNPINYVDPSGLMIKGTYNKDTGILTITDLDSGKTVSAKAFSGTSGAYSPAPNGVYTVSDFPWGSAALDNYFALLLNDGRLDDYADGYPSNYDPNKTMSNIRLHSGYISHGCLTIPSGDEDSPWLPIQEMIKNTSKGKPIVIQGQSFPNYGKITISGTGYGAVPK